MASGASAPAAPRRLTLGPAAWLPREGFVVVPLWPPEPLPDTTRARSALVGRVDGKLVAYANLCRHLAVPLDFGDGDVQNFGSSDLHCRRHGAVFNARSGACTSGPCVGRSLWPLAIEVDELGEAHLLLGGAAAGQGAPPAPR
jgi:naringenin degradation protein FdeD